MTRLRRNIRAITALAAACLAMLGSLAQPAAAQTATDLRIDSFTVATAKVEVFDAFQISAVVRNAGDTPVQNVAIRLAYSKAGPGLQEMTVLQESSVNLDGQKSIGLSWSETLPPGDHTLFVLVDPGQAIPETDETNNAMSLPVTVTRIELSPELVRRFREMAERPVPGQPLGPFRVFETLRADLYPELQRYYSGGGASQGNVGAALRNGGPDALPVAVLDTVSLTVEFVGAATDKTCTVVLSGRSQTALTPGGQISVNFYTDAVAPCPRAKVPEMSCDPAAEKRGELTFRCLLVPELRLSVSPPTGQALLSTGYFFLDPKPYNNVEIVPKGLQ